MNPAHVTLTVTVLGGLAVLGQLANYLLTLRIQNGQLKSEQRILDEVGCKYRDMHVCDAKMEALSARVSVLEPRRA